MTLCKNCKCWDDGECRKPDWVEDRRQIPSHEKEHITIYARASDYTGLTAELHTGPEFGCVLGLPKTENAKNTVFAVIQEVDNQLCSLHDTEDKALGAIISYSKDCRRNNWRPNPRIVKPYEL